MKLTIEMILESDAVFGNGLSIPGGEDIATQMDDQGFPYLKGNFPRGTDQPVKLDRKGKIGDRKDSL